MQLTDVQKIAIEAAISISNDIENERHDGSFLSDVSMQALRDLLAAPAQSAEPVEGYKVVKLDPRCDACDKGVTGVNGNGVCCATGCMADEERERARESWKQIVAAPQPSPTAVVLDERAHEWAPARVWLQREQGEGGSHTWCEDSVGDGDLIEEAEYVRVGAPSVEQTRALTDWQDRCAVLVDIYDDAMNNAPEDRCYVDGAFKAEMDEVRTLLTAARPASGETE
jgi:hypothetical protein